MILRSHSGDFVPGLSPIPEGSQEEVGSPEQLDAASAPCLRPDSISLENGLGVANTYRLVPDIPNNLRGKRVSATFQFKLAGTGRYQYCTAFTGVALEVYSRRVNGRYVEYVEVVKVS